MRTVQKWDDNFTQISSLIIPAAVRLYRQLSAVLIRQVQQKPVQIQAWFSFLGNFSSFVVLDFFFWSSLNQFKAFAGSTCSNAVTAAIIRIEEASSSTPGYIGKVDIILTLEDKNTAWIERETKV